MANPPLVVIAGPTGAGKSALAIRLAEVVGAEVVSADSQQVYRGMDIGTGKLSMDDRRGVAHHLIDIVEPTEVMTAARWATAADAAIADASSRGVPVVVAGGTGLYIRTLLLGLFEGPPADADVRARLEQVAEASGNRALWERLESVDPVMAQKIHDTDRKRIVRALEVFELTGVLMSEHQARHSHRSTPPRYPHHVLCIGPDREGLYERINTRVDDMVAGGLVNEIQGLRGQGISKQHRSQQAIGYAEVHDHLNGDLSLSDAVVLIKRNSRRYARRQLSWYRNGPGSAAVQWVGGASEVDLDPLRRYLRGSS